MSRDEWREVRREAIALDTLCFAGVQAHELAKIARLNQAQAQQLANPSDAIGSMSESIRSELGRLTALHLRGIELQQRALQEEKFQSYIEEFIYQFTKHLKAFEKPVCDQPPAAQFFVLSRYFAAIDTYRLRLL